MRPKPALAVLGLVITVGCVWATLSTEVSSQETVADAPAAKRADSSLELGSPYDLDAQASFASQLNADEHSRLVSLNSRFALADAACPLPVSARQPFYIKFHGPLGRALADQLSHAGLAFIGYAYPHAHMVRALDAAALQRVGEILRNAPEVAGTLLRRPVDSCSERAWAMFNDSEVNGAPFRVQFWRDVSVTDAETLLAANAAAVVYATRGQDGHLDFETPFVDTWLTRQALNAFVHSDLVEWIEPTPVKVVYNVDSVALSHATPAEIGPSTVYGLDGTGVVAAVWDEARARDTHVDFQNAPSPSPINNGTKRILKVDGTSLADHSTHVTGTIAGDGTGDSSARGYAPQACVLSYSWGSMDAERRLARHDYRHAADNHSYGTGTPYNYNSGYYGGYGSDTQSSDMDIRDIFLNMCKSAGNDGDISGSNGGNMTVTDDGCMKNSFTIAAVSDTGTLASFSSRGPANDGRLVPHFSANGVELRSTGPASDTAYLGPAQWSGTSMASPSACGSIVLLTQLWYREMNNRQFAPDVIRGILADTADDRGNQGPDYQYGFGIVDCKRAADLILANKNGGDNHIVRGTIRQSDVAEYDVSVTSSATPLKVVCSWLDIYASTSASTKLVNDIDLVLVEPNGTTLHYPWAGLTSGSAGNQTYQFTRNGANRRDNIELAEVDNPTVGTWKIRVSGFSIPANPQSTVLNDATGFVLVSENAIGTLQERFEDALDTSGPVNIPDNSTTGVTRTFSVSNTDAIKNVRVYVDIRHERRGDLDIYVSHGGTTAHIENSDTSTRDDIIGVYPDTRQYDDDTDAFIGAPANGTWTVQVTDTASGNTGTLDWLAIEIDYDNLPPTAEAGNNQTVNEGATVNLNGSASSDPDNDTLTYQWVRLSGPGISFTGANSATPSFTAPQVSSTQTVVVQLTVDDGNGHTDTDTINITVNDVPVPNFAPTANAGANAFAAYGATVQLDGSASSDPDNDTLTYAWTQIGGASAVTLSNSSSATPAFTAPGVDDALAFQLIVDDGHGHTDIATVTITVNAAGTGGGGGSSSGGEGDGGGGGCSSSGGQTWLYALALLSIAATLWTRKLRAWQAGT